MTVSDEKKPMELAVFDFDGTSISGNSPVTLVLTLFDEGLLPLSTSLITLAWGCAYKLNLPHNEVWVRGKVFSAFKGKPKEEVDAYLEEFYKRKIAQRFRANVDKAIQYHHDQGREVLVISASFEPIIQAVMKEHDFDMQFSTCMKVDENGCYTDQVDGEPVQGSEKLRLVTDYANKKYGENNWEIAYAYSDHDSDLPLLEAARVPVAVTPNKPLNQIAKDRGWTILQWEPR